MIIGGQVGIGDHLRVGKDAIILARSGVTKMFPLAQKWWVFRLSNPVNIGVIRQQYDSFEPVQLLQRKIYRRCRRY